MVICNTEPKRYCSLRLGLVANNLPRFNIFNTIILPNPCGSGFGLWLSFYLVLLPIVSKTSSQNSSSSMTRPMYSTIISCICIMLYYILPNWRSFHIGTVLSFPLFAKNEKLNTVSLDRCIIYIKNNNFK